MTTRKMCSVCRKFFPPTSEYFHRDRTKSDGLKPVCKKCRGIERAEYHRLNSDAERKRVREWKGRNPEKVLHNQHNYRQRHTDELHARNREYRRTHPDQIRATKHRRRAQLNRAFGSHTAADIQYLYGQQNGLCAYCSCELNGVYEVDHIKPLSRGGTDLSTNLAIACPTCNASKGHKTLQEWTPPKHR